MSKELRPTAHEYKLLEKIAGSISCWRELGGPWHTTPLWGATRSVSDVTVDGLRRHRWAKVRYERKEELTYLDITNAGDAAYEAECRRRLEFVTGKRKS